MTVEDVSEVFRVEQEIVLPLETPQLINLFDDGDKLILFYRRKPVQTLDVFKIFLVVMIKSLAAQKFLVILALVVSVQLPVKTAMVFSFCRRYFAVSIS